MKLIEHFDHVLRLVERSASYTEIKGALIGMREEVEGTQAAAAKQIETAKEKAAIEAEFEKLKSEHAKLKAQNTPPEGLPPVENFM